MAAEGNDTSGIALIQMDIWSIQGHFAGIYTILNHKSGHSTVDTGNDTGGESGGLIDDGSRIRTIHDLRILTFVQTGYSSYANLGRSSFAFILPIDSLRGIHLYISSAFTIAYGMKQRLGRLGQHAADAAYEFIVALNLSATYAVYKIAAADGHAAR